VRLRLCLRRLRLCLRWWRPVTESPAVRSSAFVASYHKFTACRWNDQDGLPGRKVWWNYWETCVRSQADYLNRLCYIFWNPVKHGLVHEPTEYRYSNYLDYLNEEWFDIGSKAVEVDHVPEF